MMWMGGSRFATQLLDQLFTIVVIRLLAPEDFGLLAMATVFTRLFTMVADMGLSRALVQQANPDDLDKSTAFWGNVAAGAILCVVGIGFADVVGKFYRQPLVVPVFSVLSLRFLLAGLSATHGALLMRDLRFSLLTIRNVISTVAGGAVGLAVAVAGGGVWSLVAQTLTAEGMKVLTLWVATKWLPRPRFSWDRFRRLWNFGSRVLGTQACSYLIKYSDNFIIGRAFGPVALGYYAFGYAVFLFPLTDISLIVARVVFSAFSRLQDDFARLREGFLLTTRYVNFFALPTLVGLWLVAGDLVEVVFGPKWIPAVPVLRVLLIAGILSAHTSVWTAILQALDRVDYSLRFAAASTAVYIPAFLFGLRWGIVGVATGYTVATALLVPFQLALVQRLLNVPLPMFVSALRPTAMAALIMMVVVGAGQLWMVGAGVPSIVRLFVAVLIGVVAYSGAVLRLQPALVSDLLNILKRIVRPQGIRLAGERA